MRNRLDCSGGPSTRHLDTLGKVAWFRTLLLLFVGTTAALGAAASAAADLDHDGLDDALEQALLLRFAPRLQLSAGECDARPAEFEPNRNHPKVHARNGALYGQAFPRVLHGLTGPLIELHYYHLWGRDCGRAGHNLDAEHVSALLSAPSPGAPPEEWKALYWYAAAHEDTVCDFSSAAKAADLQAEDAGPVIWISRGKHASFLQRSSCNWGCGGDVCQPGETLTPDRVLNVGEPGSLRAGMQWLLSPRWPMAGKLGVDFNEALVTALRHRKAAGVLPLHTPLRTPQAVLLAGDSTADALALGGAKTGNALDTAGTHTDSALDTAANKTGGAVSKSARNTGRAVGASVKKTIRFLGIGQKKGDPSDKTPASR